MNLLSACQPMRARVSPAFEWVCTDFLECWGGLFSELPLWPGWGRLPCSVAPSYALCWSCQPVSSLCVRLSCCEPPKSGPLCSSLSPRPGTESGADEMECCLESWPLMTRAVGNQRPKPFFPPEGLRTWGMKKVLQRVL